MGTVTVTKAAHILGVHPNTVRAWTDQGRLRCLRINARGDRRYRTADLESFLSGADAVGIQPRRGGRRVVPVSRGGGLSGGSRIGPFDGERPRAGEVPQDLDTGRRVEELRVIAEVARLTAHVADLGATLGEIGRVLRRTFSYQMVAILQALDGQLVVRAADGVDPATIMPLPLEAGLSGAAIRDGRPLFVPDVRDDPRYIPVLPQVRSEVAVPIFIGQEAWGCLVVADVRVDSLLEVDRELLTTIADQVASAAQNARLFGQVERQLRQADALRRISADVTSQLDLPVILNGLVEHALALFEADRAAVFLARPDGHMDAPIVRDLSATYLRAVELVPQPSLGAEVIATGRAGF
ncbi:MAG TPA: GAF domain-containing protein, partial [Candidatus Limnocylindrales bacterium]|nr:GAF domain-containing protein [Candidatus Limnocylindrales bacterium]